MIKAMKLILLMTSFLTAAAWANSDGLCAVSGDRSGDGYSERDAVVYTMWASFAGSSESLDGILLPGQGDALKEKWDKLSEEEKDAIDSYMEMEQGNDGSGINVIINEVIESSGIPFDIKKVTDSIQKEMFNDCMGNK